MAGTPQYGGTNGVSEINLGQPGSARYTGTPKLAHFRAHVLRRPPEVVQVQHGIPQQPYAFSDNLGWRGQVAMWEGSIVVQNATQLAALESELSLFLTGCSISPTTGARSQINTTYLAGTVLKDAYGVVMASKAIMTGYQFRDRWQRVSGSSQWTYLNHLSVTFRILG